MSEHWTLKGEFALSCSCMVFCPCVLSLGNHPPTESRCQTWAGIRIDSGHFDDIDLAGIKAGIMMDLPGIMSRGNWTAALFVDDKAPIQAVKGLTRIFTGRVGGSTHLLSILVGQFLGVHQVPITYETQGETRIVRIEKYVDGAHHADPRQAEGRERRHPQQRILGRLRRHRRARRQVAFPRLRPQLEPGRPLGRDHQTRLGQRVSGELRKRPRLRRSRFHRLRGGAGFFVADPGNRRALGGDVLLPRPGADRRRARRSAGARLQCRRGLAALVGRHARSHRRFHDLCVRAGLRGGGERYVAGSAGARRRRRHLHHRARSISPTAR